MELLQNRAFSGSQSVQSEPSQLTAFEWLRQYADTRILSDLLDTFPAVRGVLNDQKSECTIWAPVNAAWADFESDDDGLETLLQHHVSPHDMPLARILDTPNIPTLVYPATLNGPLPIRARPQNGRIVVNGHAMVINSDIIVTNGTIHLVDSVLRLPPPISELAAFLPESQFRHFRALLKGQDFLGKLKSSFPKGGTLFAPTNEAFRNIGFENESFWASDEGARYAEALLKYHTIPGETLYSNMFYQGENEAGVTSPPIQRKSSKPSEAQETAAKNSTPAAAASDSKPTPSPQKSSGKPKVLKGKRQFPLPTLLNGQWANVEVSRCGGVISMFVEEGRASVVAQDIMTQNGVVHAIDRLMIPPLTEGVLGADDVAQPTVENLDELKRALDGHLV